MWIIWKVFKYFAILKEEKYYFNKLFRKFSALLCFIIKYSACTFMKSGMLTWKIYVFYEENYHTIYTLNMANNP